MYEVIVRTKLNYDSETLVYKSNESQQPGKKSKENDF